MTGDDSCIGPEGIGQCRFTPAFVIAGDLACVYHTVGTLRRRMTELRGAVVVQAVDDPTDGYDAVPLPPSEDEEVRP